MPASQSIRCQLIIQHRPIDEKSDVEIEPAHERKQTFSVNLEKCGQEVSRLSLQVLQIRTHQRNRRQVGDRRDHVVRPSGADKHGGPSRGSRYTEIEARCDRYIIFCSAIAFLPPGAGSSTEKFQPLYRSVSQFQPLSSLHSDI